jgi:large subunit ribosomal protein L25
MITLNITKRPTDKTVDALRAEGSVPAVMYGPKFESTSIALDKADFAKVFKQAGESSIVELQGDGIDEQVLIHDVSFHPVTGDALHADFYVIEKGKKVTVSVPLVFVGESAAVKAGGDLMKVMHELEIEAMPKDLPHDLTVDISVLTDYEVQIHAKDIQLPAGVTLLAEPEEVIALVQEHKEEVVEETPAEFDPNAIAVEEKGKKEDEEAAAA